MAPSIQAELPFVWMTGAAAFELFPPLPLLLLCRSPCSALSGRNGVCVCVRARARACVCVFMRACTRPGSEGNGALSGCDKRCCQAGSVTNELTARAMLQWYLRRAYPHEPSLPTSPPTSARLAAHPRSPRCRGTHACVWGRCSTLAPISDCIGTHWTKQHHSLHAISALTYVAPLTYPALI